MFCRPGGAGAGGEELARVHIAWELRSGQWVFIRDDVGILAWASYWLTDDNGLQRIRTESFSEIVHSGMLIPLTHGPRAYVATAVVAPGAPHATYRLLYRLLMREVAAMGAKTISAHLVKRDGRRFWHERSVVV